MNDILPRAVETRLLLVSYYYGHHGATGAFRWTTMAESLTQRGWRFEVITATEPAAPISGVTASTIGVHWVARPQWPSRALRMLQRLFGRKYRRQASRVEQSAPLSREMAVAAMRASINRPSLPTNARTRLIMTLVTLEEYVAERMWVRQVVAIAEQLARDEPFAAVVVSSPPHVSQGAGIRIARRLGVPYIADFRDPWIAGGDHSWDAMNPLALSIGERFEREVSRKATVVVHNTAHAAEVAEAEMPGLSRRRVAIANGYDPVLVVERPDPAVFRIVYGGWIYPFMELEVLLDACAAFRARHRLTGREFRLEFLGSGREYAGIPLERLAETFGLGDCVEVADRLPRQQAIRRLQRASVLTSLDYPSPNAVPMKFYDYAQMRGEMLLIGSRGSALERAATTIGAGFCELRDAQAIAAVLDRAFQRWHAGDWDRLNDARGIHSRLCRIDEMHALLSEVVAPRATERGDQ